MSSVVHRRNFLAASAAAGAAAWLAKSPLAFATSADDRPAWKGAMIGKPDEGTLTRLKEAGFDGIESNDRHAAIDDAEAAKKLAESLGMRIHSVLYGWANFNTDSINADVESVAKSLETAAAYGADALLLVPCRIGGMPMPQPWEFQLEFDPKTNHLIRVVEGDNGPYEAYITAHNHAIDASRKAIEKLIPHAEKTGVVVALENVWNNLWVKPAHFANFVKSFDHPKVQTYYDVGNHVKYAPPQEWIKALGTSIVKIHIKDFALNPDGHGGKFVHPRDGSVDWPAVHDLLVDIGYDGWLTIEDGGLELTEFRRRLDLIIAGK
ncbi:MAG: sugar phosphate isomerase/epimerase [Planctomycetota bacterium]|nr:MAG: sugar phosphate isomerase/epimerase [Planctomycetota bacterium]